MTQQAMNFDRAAPEPRQAFFILPWENRGHTVGFIGADGLFYGARDVSFGRDHDAIVSAWRRDAERKGLRIITTETANS